MPLTSGSITCRAYIVSQPPPDDFLASAAKDLRRHAFQPVRPERSPRSIGWVSPRNILDTDLKPEILVFEDFLVLGIRVDKVSINSRLLKAHFAKAINELVRERQRKSLGREERAALLEKVKMDLLGRQTPSTSIYEMAWNLRTHHVYFSATGESLNQEFCDLFGDTFHTALAPLLPFIRASRKAESDGLQEQLLETMPARIGVASVRTYVSEEE